MEDFQPMKHLNISEYAGDPNMLAEIFNKQRKLFSKYEWAAFMDHEELTMMYAQAIASESQELMNQTNWKKWKSTAKPFDRKETIFEYIDIITFAVNGLIALGVDSEECAKYFLAKNKENLDRIERGY